MTVLDSPQVPPAVRPDSLDDPLVPEAPGTAIRFYAKSLNYRAIRQPQTHIQGATGQRQEVLKPVRYEFSPDGTLTVRVGNDVLPDGEYDPDAGAGTPLDAVGWLRRHHDLNVYFWEEGREPGRPQPTETEFLKSANEAFQGENVERLVELLVQERNTHGREVLIGAVENQISLLGAEVPAGEVNVQAPEPRPPTEADVKAEEAAALAGEARKGEGGIPLESSAPYRPPSRGIF